LIALIDSLRNILAQIGAIRLHIEKMVVEIPKGRYLIPNHHPVIPAKPVVPLIKTIDLYYLGTSNTH